MASGSYNLLEVTPTINTVEYAVGDCIFISTEIEGFSEVIMMQLK